MTQPLTQPGFITEAVTEARRALIGRLLDPPAISEREYKQAIKAMAESMDITEDAALKILTGDLHG